MFVSTYRVSKVNLAPGEVIRTVAVDWVPDIMLRGDEEAEDGQEADRIATVEPVHEAVSSSSFGVGRVSYNSQ